MQEQEQQQHNIAIRPTSQLSTPQLLDYFHQEHEQQNENVDNQINLVIDIPDDAVAVNMNNNSDIDQNNDYQPSPTNSQLGNM
jgi:hypothetical protein